jgi:hypothetical protein
MRERRMGRLAAAAILWVAADARAQSGQPPAPSPSPAARPQVFVAVYERGTVWDDGKGAFEQAGIGGHIQFLRTNADKLVGAAPFGDSLAAGSSDRIVGMVIIAAASQQEAESLIAGDPAVSSKLMKATVRRWMVDRLKAY